MHNLTYMRELVAGARDAIERGPIARFADAVLGGCTALGRRSPA